jgi:hypothetical protein
MNLQTERYVQRKTDLNSSVKDSYPFFKPTSPPAIHFSIFFLLNFGSFQIPWTSPPFLPMACDMLSFLKPVEFTSFLD